MPSATVRRPSPGLLPHHPTIPTSRANAVRTSAPLLKDARRTAILQSLRHMGGFGATRAELSEWLDIPIQSVCPLIVWLRDTTKEVEQTDTRRNGGFVLVAAQTTGGSLND